MSQDDVYRAARAGETAGGILAQSFPGTALVREPAAALRVLVADIAPRVVVAGRTRLRLTDEGGRLRGRALRAGHRYEIRRRGGAFVARDLDARVPPLRLRGPLLIDARRAPSGVRMAEPLDRRYRGALRILPGPGTRMSVVNVVGLESYLRGVLPGELPSWGPRAAQALTAGAILARSRALAQRGAPGTLYDATADDPLYLGLDGERPESSRAVLASHGLAVAAGGTMVAAAFAAAPDAPVPAFTPSQGTPDPVAEAPARAVPGARPGLAPAAVARAMAQIGTPYLWGGEAPGGFDCSGLVYWAYGTLGVQLPRVAEDQATAGTPVPRDQLVPGDAVFFADSSGYIHHEGLYIGDGRFVHAPQTGERVSIESLDTPYYARQYAGARRYSPAS